MEPKDLKDIKQALARIKILADQQKKDLDKVKVERDNALREVRSLQFFLENLYYQLPNGSVKNTIRNYFRRLGR